MIQVLTVKSKIPLFKGETPAEKIELLQFEEVDFEVVRMKGLNEIGEQVLFVYPDYCLPNNELFAEFVNPSDGSKSKLGGNNRVRAIKFNLHRGDNDPVYSNGIIFGYNEIQDYLRLYKPDLLGAFETLESEDLGITKWVPEEDRPTNSGKSRSGKPLPYYIYRTDEDNILAARLPFPAVYRGTVKVDGSSITIFATSDGQYGVCSRNLTKDLTVQKVVGQRKLKWFEYITRLFKPIDLNIYETFPSDDKFVVAARPYLQVLNQCTQKYGSSIVLRGELCGQGNSGSGNAKNPHAKLPSQILWYNLDWLRTRDRRIMATPLMFEDLQNAVDTLNEFDYGVNFKTVDSIFNREFQSKTELVQFCYDYFKTNMIEGIVVKTTNEKGAVVSAKVMNLEYDSKK